MNVYFRSHYLKLYVTDIPKWTTWMMIGKLWLCFVCVVTSIRTNSQNLLIYTIPSNLPCEASIFKRGSRLAATITILVRTYCRVVIELNFVFCCYFWFYCPFQQIFQNAVVIMLEWKLLLLRVMNKLFLCVLLQLKRTDVRFKNKNCVINKIWMLKITRFLPRFFTI